MNFLFDQDAKTCVMQRIIIVLATMDKLKRRFFDIQDILE